MFAIPGLLALLACVYLRPQEFTPALQRVPLLYLAVLLVVVGFALDVRVGFARLRASPLLPWAAAFFGWSMLTLLVMAPTAFAREAMISFISFFLFASLATSLQTLRAWQAVCGFLLLLSLALAAIGLHQATAPLGCLEQDELDPEVWQPDGRACATRLDCSESSLAAGGRYRCEHLGLFGTTSVEGRIRYRGIMEDPNELALVLSLALPFAFVPLQLRQTLPRTLLAVGALLVIGACTIRTQSRSGQLAFLAVLSAYLVRRIGWVGLAAAATLGAPVLLLGGRADAGADQSTMERLECWATAIELFRGSPLLGVGKGQFTEHHYLTAHNSFLLALAELGLPGLFLWSVVVYLAFKTTRALLLSALPPGGRPAHLAAGALLASLAALIVSSSFLSLTEHNVLWIYLGLAGALGSAARAHDPSWRLRLTRKDAALILVLDLALIAAVTVYTRMHGA